jgi:maltooligosyltrehalose trehalohydrolase
MDDRGSDGVRALLIGSALRWLEEFHLDGLRLDAVDQIADMSAVHFLAELSDRTRELEERAGRPLHLIAESDLNDPRMVVPRAAGGLGMDAQWSGDLHHALHALLTGEREGYYADFGGTAALATAYREPFVYAGRHSRHRGRRHGAPALGIHGSRFVTFAENHDQVGNRMLGDRLAATAGLERARLAAGAVLLAPYLPLLFMGEEYAEQAPFLYFTSHADPALADAVRRGRTEEFAAFRWAGEPPDPQAEETFRRSILHWDARTSPPHAGMLDLHRELLRLRRELGPLRDPDPGRVETARTDAPPVVWVRRWDEAAQILLVLHFGTGEARLEVPFADADWRPLLDSADTRFGGPGAGRLQGCLTMAPTSFVLLEGRERG